MVKLDGMKFTLKCIENKIILKEKYLNLTGNVYRMQLTQKYE